MQATQRQILQLILASEQGISDQQLLEKLGKDIQEVRFHLDELSRGGFIKLITDTTFNGEFYLATSVTPRGCMVLQGQISLEDRVDSKFDSQTFNTNNAPVSAQQLGNQNTVNLASAEEIS
jgi:repressor of nif and glnA expression